MASISKRESGAWQNTSYGIRATVTDTITTLPTTIYGDGTNAMVSIKGNTVQSGTPTPDNPIMPEGTGERTGNLLQIPDVAETTKSGVTYHVKGNSLYIDGTSTTAFGINIKNAFTLKAGTYTNQMYGFTGGRIYYSFSNVSATMCTSDVNLHKTFTISEVTTYANALVWINNGVTFNNEKIDFALFESEVPKDYEPYGYKIPILSNSTTTPVYLGEVQSTRKIKKYEFTGNENWFVSTAQSGRFGFALSDYLKSNLNVTSVCSHYVAVEQRTSGSVANNSQYFYSGSDSARYIFIVDERYTTAADFQIYLAQQYAAGTPVTVWYVLATEETAVVNEPLMRIGDYADEVSGVSIPTTDGANTLSVDTTVQPSEVSINYHGWHMGNVHERASGEWD